MISELPSWNEEEHLKKKKKKKNKTGKVNSSEVAASWGLCWLK